jgi:hypothetical protein
MSPIHTSIQLKRTAPLIMFCLSTVSAFPQTSQDPAPRVESALSPGTTVWITDSAGREEKRLIVSVSDGIVTTSANEDVRRFRTTDIARVRARHSDSVINGALIGAGAAVASGLFLCTRTEPWENCRDDVGPILRIAAIGAGAGIGIDALIRGRRTIYEAPKSTRLHAVPIAARGAAGLSVSVSF